MDFSNAWSLIAVFGQFVNVHAPFTQHIGDITGFDAVIFGDAVVTRAKCTQAFTKRQVNVQADAVVLVGFDKGARQCLQIGRYGEILLLPIRNRRIAGVARAGDIVFVN